jgi:hypothetical protein
MKNMKIIFLSVIAIISVLMILGCISVVVPKDTDRDRDRDRDRERSIQKGDVIVDVFKVSSSRHGVDFINGRGIVFRLVGLDQNEKRYIDKFDDRQVKAEIRVLSVESRREINAHFIRILN